MPIPASTDLTEFVYISCRKKYCIPFRCPSAGARGICPSLSPTRRHWLTPNYDRLSYLRTNRIVVFQYAATFTHHRRRTLYLVFMFARSLGALAVPEVPSWWHWVRRLLMQKVRTILLHVHHWRSLRIPWQTFCRFLNVHRRLFEHCLLSYSSQRLDYNR